MIYKSLDTIPFKTLLNILKTEDVSLLSTKPVKGKKKEKLQEIWNVLKEEYEQLDPDKEFEKTLKIKKRIERLSNQYKAVNLAVKGLRFGYNQELIDILQKKRYKITEESYFTDLDTIERESESLLVIISKLENSLPKQQESNENIDKIIIAYNNGVMLDTNSVTVMQFYGAKELFEEKIKSLENNVNK